MKATLLKPLYHKAVGGLPVLGTPEEVARRISRGAPDAAAAADRLVALYVGLCGATGFVCGLPGFLLMPVTVPANLTGVALLQLHMSAALAVLAGHDLADEATRDRYIACLLEKLDESGRNTEDEEVARRTGIKLGERALRYVAEKSTRLAVRAARGAALRKLGARRLPLVGGALGAGSDAYTTSAVGRCAKHAFASNGA